MQSAVLLPVSFIGCAAVLPPFHCQAMPSLFPYGILSRWQHINAASRNRSGVIRRHLKFMSVQNTTFARFFFASERFWSDCDFSFGHVRRSARELDLFVGEPVDCLFHGACPFQWSGDTLAAVRRFLSSRSHNTYLPKAYLRNWSTTHHVRRDVSPSLGDSGFHALFGGWHVVCELCA